MMGFKREREGPPDYDVASEEQVLAGGPGGEGNMISNRDARRRNVTPELARKLAREAGKPVPARPAAASSRPSNESANDPE